MYIYIHGKLYIYTPTDTYKYFIHIIIRPSYLWRYTPIYPICSWLWRIYRKPSAGFATQVPSQFRPWQVSLRCGWRKLMGCWTLQMVGWTIKNDCTMRNGHLTITSSDLSIKHIDLTSRIRDIASQKNWWYNMGMQWEYSRDTLDELRRPHCDVVGMIVRIGVLVQDLSQNGRTFCAGELLQFGVTLKISETLEHSVLVTVELVSKGFEGRDLVCTVEWGGKTHEGEWRSDAMKEYTNGGFPSHVWLPESNWLVVSRIFDVPT